MPDIGFKEAGRGVMNAVYLTVALAAITSAAASAAAMTAGSTAAADSKRLEHPV